jgi:methyl-accepting chemotaxis protein
MMMAGGTTMFMDSLSRKGVGGWAEAIGGGAMTGFALGGPIGAGIGALAGLGTRLAKLAMGKNAYEAGSMEVSRDFGGIQMSQDDWKGFLDQNQISESDAYPIRRNIQTSPEFLQTLYGYAEQQGKVDEFMKSLEKIGYGTTNEFKGAFDVGRLTGDWSQLNKVWKENLSLGQGVSEQIRDSLLIDDNTLKSYEQLIVDLNSLKKSVQESIPPVTTMYQTFLETAEITQDLRDQVVKLGGDIADFEKVSELTRLNNDFNDMVEHFRETGEILPRLRQMFIDFGGDLSKLDDAAQLPGLRESLTFINSLQSGLQALAPELDPIKALLSGQWNTNIVSALSAAGLDPSKFEGLSPLIGMEQNWSKIATPFTRLTPELEKALKMYGGEEGNLAVERYSHGFNTITEGLLNTTKQAMDEAYQAAVKDALDYIGTAQKETSDKITTLTTAVEEQFTIVSKNITDAITDAKEALIDELAKLINLAAGLGDNSVSTPGSSTIPGTADQPNTDPWQQYQQAHDAWAQSFNQILSTAGPEVAQQWAMMNPEPQPPQAHTGGLIIEAQPGEAVLDREQTRNLLRTSQARPIVQLINCTIYGFQDFVEQVRQAGLDLQRRGDPQWA